MNKLIIIAMFCCIALVGCTEREIENSGKIIELVTIPETYAGNHSRTQVGDVSETGIQMLWSPQDAIGVFGDSRNNVQFTNTQTSPSATATFRGTFNGTPEYVYYPYASSATDRTNIPVSISTDQSYKDVTSIASYDVKVGTVIKTSNTYSISFQQLASLVRFEINLSGVEGLNLQEGETLTRVELQAKKTLTGNFTLNLDLIEQGLKEVDNECSTSLNLVFENTPALSADESIVAYAVLAPGTHNGEEWECAIKTSHHLIQFETTIHADLVQGTYSTLPLNAVVLGNSHHHDENGDQITGAKIEGLGTEEPETPVTPTGETANCYMISAPGTYAFDATVIGNGEKGIIANAGFHTESVTISPSSVELLWQDTPGFITSVSLDNGVVTYTAGGNVGNAQIAVKDNNGTILWSWHIWGTGDRAVEDEIITNRAGNKFSVMDRTLGQLHKLTLSDVTAEDGTIYTYTYHKTDPTIKLTVGDIYPLSNQAVLYQWGRKDPIPSAVTYYDINNNPTDITTYPVIKPTEASEATILYSIQHADYFIDIYSLVSNGLWLSEENNSELLWGDSYVADATYTDDDAAIGWTHSKTIYDPCPAGYRVANRFMQTSFMVQKSDNNTASFTNDDDALTDITSIMDVITTTYLTGTTTRYAPVYSRGYFFGQDDEGTDKGSYFPQVSYRQGGGGFNSSSKDMRSYYWTSSPSSSYTNAQSWFFEAFVKTNSSMTGKIDVGETTQKRYANPVRCVREQRQ